ncbi:MAG: polyisoprenoid-binding protein YceI [Cognaticolwellia sp.]|jgi:polyisoprenoid-binding protein YceI
MEKTTMTSRALIGSVLLLLPSLAFGAWNVEGKSKITFHADGPAGFAIDGASSEFSVSETPESMVFTVPVSAVSTGIDLRDAHMRNYVEAETFPTVTLTIPKDQLNFPAEGQKKSVGIAQGTFNMHGVDKPAKVKYAMKTEKKGVSWVASFGFNTEAHGIIVPEYMGVTADPAMSAQAKFTTVPAE